MSGQGTPITVSREAAVNVQGDTPPFMLCSAGVDMDYEPDESQLNCAVTAAGVSCATDAQSVAVTAALRSAFPKGQYLMIAATWHVGCYGQ